MMQLNAYPTAIAAAAQSLADLEGKFQACKQAIELAESDADLSVAFDQDLKNDNQRRARKAEILKHDSRYQEMIRDLLLLANDRTDALNDLERLRNQFAVAKIESRMQIAQMLVGLDSRDLVGL